MSTSTASDQSGEQGNRLLNLVHDYHQLTKHHFKQYAPGPEALDWDDQPSAFRSFENAPKVSLPLKPQVSAAEFSADQLFFCQPKQQPLTLDTLSFFLLNSAGLTAWKQHGPDSWSLRAVPSSGNLHPGELYLLLPETTDWQNGLYHYDPLYHQLELRRSFAEPVTSPLLFLTSVLDREAWKYGERAYRYCCLDAGHQLAQAKAAAGLLGWQLSSLPEQSSDVFSSLCGLDRTEFGAVEPEFPMQAALISMDQSAALDVNADATFRTAASDSLSLSHINQGPSEWYGVPSKLNGFSPYKWKSCFNIAQQFKEVPIQGLYPEADVIKPAPKKKNLTSDLNATQVIKQRRSAQAYEGAWEMSKDDFSQLMSSLMPAATDLIPAKAQVHMLCFVHAVEGMQPGIYLLPRTPEALALFKTNITRWSDWEAYELDDGTCLQRLKVANTRKAIAQLGCHQSIAANSAVTLVMLSEFNQLSENSSLLYPALFQEAGILGQQLYLMTTALGFNATGIGCFFDDGIHDLLGFADTDIQAVYGFAMGKAIVDHRITSLSGYHHLQGNQNKQEASDHG